MDIKAQIQEEAEKRYPIPSEGEYYLGNTTPSYIHFCNKQTKNMAKFIAGAEWMLSQSSELKKENERLRGLLETTVKDALKLDAIIANWTPGQLKSMQEKEWLQFKTENNL